MSHNAILDIPSDVSALWGSITPGVEQTRAIELASRHRVMALVGGPGTGKSQSTRAIIALLKHNRISFTCVAPTGKAAMRMTELTGEKASTIHRAIIPVKGLAQKMIESGAVIADEMSMVCVEVMSALMSSVSDTTRLILVGDGDQLPSIGAGRVLSDIIASGKVPVARLTQIYRQASDSRIPYVARDINEGRTPDLSLKGTDVSHIEIEEDATIKDETERRAAQLANVQAMIVHAVTKTIPHHKGIPTSAIQVICAQKNRSIGVEEMNRVLQEAINPRADRPEIWIGAGYVARVNDKVMQKKNNYDFGPGLGEGVFNGEIGMVEEVAASFKDGISPGLDVLTSYRNPNSKKAKRGDSVVLVVNFNDGEKRVGYTKDEARDLHLAYASTVHSMQGSQSRAVVFPVHSTHHWMLTRKLVYTGITRAAEFMLFVGNASAVAKAARVTRGDERRTSLQERLTGMRPVVTSAKPSLIPPASEDKPQTLATRPLVLPAAQTIHVSSADLDAFWANRNDPNMTVLPDNDAALDEIDIGETADHQALPPVSTSATTRTKLLPGHYLIGHTIFRIVTKKKGGMAGKTLVEIFDEKLDQYNGVAFLDDTGYYANVWKKHRDDLSLCNAIKALTSDPRQAGMDYAGKTGRCVVCARKLEDPISVDLGIGPSCRSRWL